MEEGKKESLWDIIKFAIITLAIVVPIRTFIVQPFIVSGASMDPTFKDGDYLIVDELSYLTRSPKRGEVVIFRYPKDPSKFFIKRLIGLPGETVTISGEQVVVMNKAGRIVMQEPYVKFSKDDDNVTDTLGSSEYFVMGDNRKASLDSRYWGPVPEENMQGRVMARLFPFNKVNYLPGDFSKK